MEGVYDAEFEVSSSEVQILQLSHVKYLIKYLGDIVMHFRKSEINNKSCSVFVLGVCVCSVCVLCVHVCALCVLCVYCVCTVYCFFLFFFGLVTRGGGLPQRA